MIMTVMMTTSAMHLQYLINWNPISDHIGRWPNHVKPMSLINTIMHITSKKLINVNLNHNILYYWHHEFYRVLIVHHTTT